MLPRGRFVFRVLPTTPDPLLPVHMLVVVGLQPCVPRQDSAFGCDASCSSHRDCCALQPAVQNSGSDRTADLGKSVPNNHLSAHSCVRHPAQLLAQLVSGCCHWLGAFC
jgi:hypothetical protein